jgi:hypothetical protein
MIDKKINKNTNLGEFFYYCHLLEQQGYSCISSDSVDPEQKDGELQFSLHEYDICTLKMIK